MYRNLVEHIEDRLEWARLWCQKQIQPSRQAERRYAQETRRLASAEKRTAEKGLPLPLAAILKEMEDEEAVFLMLLVSATIYASTDESDGQLMTVKRKRVGRRREAPEIGQMASSMYGENVNGLNRLYWIVRPDGPISRLGVVVQGCAGGITGFNSGNVYLPIWLFRTIFGDSVLTRIPAAEVPAVLPNGEWARIERIVEAFRRSSHHRFEAEIRTLERLVAALEVVPKTGCGPANGIRLSGIVALKEIRDAFQRMEKVGWRSGTVQEKDAWRHFRRALVTNHGRLLPLLSAMRMKGEGTRAILPALELRTGASAGINRHLGTTPRPERRRPIRPFEEPASDPIPGHLEAVVAEMTNENLETLIAPVEAVLNLDPTETGWREWWGEIVALHAILERIRAFETSFAARRSPLQEDDHLRGVVVPFRARRVAARE